jgi:ribosomal protein L22
MSDKDPKDPKDRVETEGESPEAKVPAPKPAKKRFGKKRAAKEEPVAEAPAADEPVVEEPVAGEPVVEEPVAGEPVVEEPVAGDPVAEDPVAEEPSEEQPVVEEQPVAAKPITKRPAAEKPPAAMPAARRPAANGKVARDKHGRPIVNGPVVRAHAKYVRTSARKARLVCDHIRGKSVDEAVAILAHTPRAVAEDWEKLLKSAVANAEHNHELLGDDLKIHAVFADEGPTLKRFRPRAMGRATQIRKRTSHLTIQLTPKEQ